jgi:RNA polymerase sigma-70 factor (family 1)
VKFKSLYDEKDLLNKVALGNEKAFQIIFHLYRNKIFSYSFRLLQVESLAEEIVQDVFIKLWINRATIGNIENFGGYIRHITRNYAISALRKTAREMNAFNSKNQNWTEADLDTENDIIYRDTQKILIQAMDTLPPQQKLVYNLCKIDGLKQEEVAQRLNISVLTVKTHLKIANRSIRSYIRQHTDILPLLFFISVNQLFIK